MQPSFPQRQPGFSQFSMAQHQYPAANIDGKSCDLNLEDLNLGGGVSDEEEDQEEVNTMRKMLEKRTR